MRFRDHVALTLPALILRLLLCLTFAWAGLGKILGEISVTGQDAARLAAMGVALTPTDQPNPTDPSPTDPSETPLRDLPDTTEPPTQPAAVPPVGNDRPAPTELIDPQTLPQSESASEPEPPTTSTDTLGQVAESARTTTNQTTDQTAARQAATPQGSWSPDQVVGTTYQPEDYPGVYTVQRVCGVALILSKAGNPGLDAQSNPIPNTMPAWVSASKWPIHLAWAAAITELLAAVMLLFGVLTRLGALMLVSVMLTAIWLTQVGPAVVGIRDAFLGFIPAADDPWSPQAYSTLLWQVACLGMSAAVFALGSGPIGFDRALFRPTEPLERTEPPKRDRSVFDRGPSQQP